MGRINKYDQWAQSVLKQVLAFFLVIALVLYLFIVFTALFNKVCSIYFLYSTTIITVWILLEDAPRPIKVDVDVSKYTFRNFSLDRLVPFIIKEFKALKDVEPEYIEFFNNDNRTTPPLVVRYPLSESSSKYAIRLLTR